MRSGRDATETQREPPQRLGEDCDRDTETEILLVSVLVPRQATETRRHRDSSWSLCLCGYFLCASVALWLFSLCLCGISRRQRAANRERRHQAGLAGNIVKPIIPRTAAETHRELPHRHGDIEIVLVSVPLWLFLPALCLCGSVAVSPYLSVSVALHEAGVRRTAADAIKRANLVNFVGPAPAHPA